MEKEIGNCTKQKEQEDLLNVLFQRMSKAVNYHKENARQLDRIYSRLNVQEVTPGDQCCEEKPVGDDFVSRLKYQLNEFEGCNNDFVRLLNLFEELI